MNLLISGGDKNVSNYVSIKCYINNEIWKMPHRYGGQQYYTCTAVFNEDLNRGTPVPHSAGCNQCVIEALAISGMSCEQCGTSSHTDLSTSSIGPSVASLSTRGFPVSEDSACINQSRETLVFALPTSKVALGAL